ncbi:hypothetical protein BGZ98_009968 [Dissophora globulifera]|nr:hypothetical protein BGZ98_009968 [Dissophora globulifera]
MTASAPASPALTQAQTKDLAQFDQSAALALLQQNALLHQHQSHLQSVSPTMSASSVSSPSTHHTFQTSPQQQNLYALDQHYHHMQILGNHPASPASNALFLELPSSSSASSAAHATSLVFSDCDTSMAELLPYSTSVPAAEDCQASHDYMFAAHPQQQQQHSHHHSQPSIKNEFANDDFAAIGPSYMMSMPRSFSDGQLSEICGSTVAAKAAEMCDSPLMYANQQGLYYDEDCNQYHHAQYQQQSHHQHQHSYSTSSLSTFSSDDSSMSPRSTFSSSGSLSLSNSNHSITSSYPLSRTLSEPTMMSPLFHNHSHGGHSHLISSSSSLSDLISDSSLSASTDSTISSLNKTTPKRSRGRRVSSHPDNSGCKVFTCRFEDCGKIFKRSEHLKRHVRSIHTLEKPFPCPIHNCPKRFSRSDNLNQHIRIHRHTAGAGARSNASNVSAASVMSAGDKNSKAFAAFTPFLQTYTTDLITL